MACECVSRIDEQLSPDHKLDISIFFETDRTLAGRPYSRILRKDNGKPETRSRKPSVFSFTYCPFCGVRYQAEIATDGKD